MYYRISYPTEILYHYPVYRRQYLPLYLFDDDSLGLVHPCKVPKRKPCSRRGLKSQEVYEKSKVVPVPVPEGEHTGVQIPITVHTKPTESQDVPMKPKNDNALDTEKTKLSDSHSESGSLVDQLRHADEEPLLMPMEEFLANSDSSSVVSKQEEENVEEIEVQLVKPLQEVKLEDQVDQSDEIAEEQWNVLQKTFEIDHFYDDQDFVFILNCPEHVTKETLSVQVQDHVLDVSESTSGYKYSFSLPEDVDPEKVNAAFNNGKLTLSFKKQRKTFKIDIL